MLFVLTCVVFNYRCEAATRIRHDRAVEANPTLPFATAPELFLDSGVEWEVILDTKGPQLVAYFFVALFFPDLPIGHKQQLIDCVLNLNSFFFLA